MVGAIGLCACGGGEDEAGRTTVIDATTLSTVTSDPDATSTSVAAAPASTVAEATDRGAAFVAAQLDRIDIASASMFDYLARNFDVRALDLVRPAAVERASSAELVDDELLLERLVVVDAPPPSDLSGAERTTGVLAAALHCDRVPLGAEQLAALDALVDGGGYDSTHAALALGWINELGCATPETDALRQRTVVRMGGEFGARDGVTDLALEQSATLLYLGGGDLVPATWVDETLAAQRSDGGWGESASNWHMTLLAIWTVQAATAPGNGAPMVLATD